jgi:hypothetical protein
LKEPVTSGQDTGGVEMDISFDLEYIKSDENVLDVIIRRISEKTGKSAKEVLAEINRRHSELNLLAIEVVALIVAKEMNVDISDLIDKVEEEFLS